VKTFDELYAELNRKITYRDEETGSTRLIDSGVHEIGKKIVEEAAEVWMAAEHEGTERAAEEIAQLLYHVQCMMLASKVSLEDVYRRL
jgi:phosphoribosyl-ATP pyrophosphohydrolase